MDEYFSFSAYIGQCSSDPQICPPCRFDPKTDFEYGWLEDPAS